MKSGTLLSDVQTPGVVEIVRVGGTAYGIELTDFCASLSMPVQSVLHRPTVLNTAPVSVPADFFGYTIQNVGCGDGLTPTPASGTVFQWWRLLGFNTYWPQIETADNVFDWSKMDAAIAAAQAAGKKVLWCVAYTPAFHAANTSIYKNTPAATSGWPSAPADLAASQQTWPTPNSAKWKRFISAGLTRYAGKIHAVCCWNEPNAYIYLTAKSNQAPNGNWADQTSTGVFKTPAVVPAGTPNLSAYQQNFGQLILMLADLYNTAKSIDSSILVLGPDFLGETDDRPFGGKQSLVQCYTNWFAGGGHAWCDAYAYHGYWNESNNIANPLGNPWGSVDGVSKRSVAIYQQLEAARVAAGAPVKPWVQTETGHEQMNYMPLDWQEKWIARNLIIAAALGQRAWMGYAYDSTNPATAQMSFVDWQDRRTPTPVLGYANTWAARVCGATIGAGACVLNSGHVCATINGVAYVV